MNKLIFFFILIIFIIGCSKERVEYEDFGVEEEITEEVKEEVEAESEPQYGYIVEQKAIEDKVEEKKEEESKNAVCLYFFHNNRGSPCIREKEFLFELQKKYPNLIVKEFITNTKENINLLYDLAEKYGFKVEFVPITFIGEEVIFGYYDDSTTGKEIEDIIEGCVGCGCPSAD